MDYGLFAHPHGNPFWNTSLPNQPSSSGATKSLANGNEQSPANTVSYSSSDHLSSMEGPPMTVYYPQYPFPQSQPNNHSNQSMANTCNDHDLMLRSMSYSPGEKTNDGLFSRHRQHRAQQAMDFGLSTAIQRQPPPHQPPPLLQQGQYCCDPKHLLQYTLSPSSISPVTPVTPRTPLTPVLAHNTRSKSPVSHTNEDLGDSSFHMPMRIGPYCGFKEDDDDCDDNDDEYRPPNGTIQHRRLRKTSSCSIGGASDYDKTFACDQCERSFRRQEHLKRHIRSLHTKEKRKCLHSRTWLIKAFTCLECQKRFSRSDNLSQHMRVHVKNNEPADWSPSLLHHHRPRKRRLY